MSEELRCLGLLNVLEKDQEVPDGLVQLFGEPCIRLAEGIKTYISKVDMDTYYVSYWGWGRRGGARLAHSNVSQQQGFGFKPASRLGPLCMEFTCSTHAYTGFCWVLQIPAVQRDGD